MATEDCPLVINVYNLEITIKRKLSFAQKTQYKDTLEIHRSPAMVLFSIEVQPFPSKKEGDK